MKPSVLLLIVVSILVFLVSMPNTSQALESNTEYFISSQEMFLIVEVDSSNKVTFVDGGISVNGEWYEFDEKQVKVWRTTDNGDKGRFFGQTTQGDHYYAKYVIEDDNAKLFSKLWHNDTKIRIVENATVEKLFG